MESRALKLLDLNPAEKFELEIIKQLDMICDCFSRPRFQPFTVGEMVKKIKIYPPEVVREALEEVSLMLDMPSVGEIVELCRQKLKRHTMERPREKFNPDTSSANLVSAVMSALCLHYEFGWKEADFQGSVFRQAFEKCFPGEAFNFDKLKKCFTEEEVCKWMSERENKNGFAAL